jgi:hypothetical protein
MMNSETVKLMDHREAYDQFLDFETMMRVYGWSSESPISSLIRSFKDIDNLTVDGLTELIFLLFNKYPSTGNIDLLRHGAKRGVQMRHYERVFGNKPNNKLLIIDGDVISMLGLRDTPFEPPPIVEEKVKEKPKELKPKKEKKQRECKDVKPKTEFSAKIKVMSLEEVIKWAREVGIPDDKIQNHSSKPLGLAKMSLANMIRARIDVSKT